MKRLYHYTSIERWALIEAAGMLATTESNLHPTIPHAGPDVVWLTTDAELGHGHGLTTTTDGTDKTAVRITVELPNKYVHKWREWAIRHGVERRWLDALDKTGGGGSATWRVVERPIRAERFIDVHVRSDLGTVMKDAVLV